MKLPRPHIPLRVRVQVAERDCAHAGMRFAVSADFEFWPDSRKLRFLLHEMRRWYGMPVELHHRPALCNRLKVNIHGSHFDYSPAANDPDFLIYLPADEHDIETRVRGQHGDYSDLAKARKRKRKERKAKRRKTRWPSRPLRSRRVRG